MEHKTILDRVFDDFVKRLRESKAIDEMATARLEEMLRRRELRADKIKAVLFARDDLQ